MTHTELAVLDAVNIATTIHRRKGHGFEATAAQHSKRPRKPPERSLSRSMTPTPSGSA